MTASQPARRAPAAATTPRPAPTACDLSVVLPCHDEVESLAELIHRLASAFPASGPVQAEFVVVDDGSRDGSDRLLQRLRLVEPRLVVVPRSARGGQSVALWDGLAAARGTYIAHLDCDLQNDPDDLPGMLELARAGFDAVLGYRAQRHDRWSRRAASTFANVVRRAVLHDHVRDVGCSTRVVRRDVLQGLPMVPNVHRYLPALLERSGCRIMQVAVHHHPRRAGRSKYGNLRRGLVGLVDLPRMVKLADRLERSHKEKAHVP